MVVYRECSVARLGEFSHEYASAVTRAAGGFCRERLETCRVAKIEFTNWQFFEPHLIEDRCSRGSKSKAHKPGKAFPKKWRESLTNRVAR